QNKTRTPLADVPRGANSSSRRPGIRLVSSRVAHSARPKSGTRFCGDDQACADSAIIMIRYAGKGPEPTRFPRFHSGTRHSDAIRPRRRVHKVKTWSQTTCPKGDLRRRRRGRGRRPLWPPRHTAPINVLLCIVKGFALAKPLCCRIKYG